MTRSSRITVELFAPPLLGSTPFLFMAIISGTVGLIPVILAFAYLVAILPSMIFTGVLELAFWWGLDPRSPKAVLLAGGLGVASGIAIGLMPRVPTAVEKAVFFGLIGMVVGTSTALIVRWRSAPPGGAALPPCSPSTS
jgi:hypothetical protein